MRKMFSSCTGLTAALVLTLSACNDGITGVTSGDELTTEEVAAVIAVLASSFESVGVSAQAPVASPALAPISVNEGFSVSVPCEAGTVDLSGSLSGTVDDVTFATDARIEASWQPNACVVSDGTNTFTVDGAPRVDLALDFTSSEQGLTMNGTESGGFSYTSSDGRAGSCAIDVTFSIVTSQTGAEATVNGSVCGLEASAFATLGT